MDNGTSARVMGQFDALAWLPGSWDHNRQYQREILRMAGRRGASLDIGCGTGELTRALALRSGSVVGVDASPGMIAEARRRNWGLNISYVEGDAAAFLGGREAEFDLITSVAAFHHMDEARMLGLCKAALRPGGVLIILDLLEVSTLADFLVSALALALNPFFYLANTGRIGTSREEREAWSSHRRDDRYETLSGIRSMARRALGDCRVERKLFWRYLLAYRKA